MRGLGLKCFLKVVFFPLNNHRYLINFNVEYRHDKKYQSVPKYVSSHCKQKISFDLDDFDVETISTYKSVFNDVGVDFHALDNTVEIIKVPQCFINKTEKTVR